MVNRHQDRQHPWLSLIPIGAFILSAPILTGCSSAPTTAQQSHDPLHGVLIPPGAPTQPTNGPKASNTPIAPPPLTGGIPPIPTNNTATNPATLASFSGYQSSLGRPLAITDEEGRVQTAVRTQPNGYVPANPNPKFEPVPDANPTSPNATATGSWQLPASDVPPTLPAADSAKANPADALRQQLQAHGVVNQKVDPVPGGVRLMCSLARTNSAEVPVIEVTAADYATAAQAILRQLDPRQP